MVRKEKDGEDVGKEKREKRKMIEKGNYERQRREGKKKRREEKGEERKKKGK